MWNTVKNERGELNYAALSKQLYSPHLVWLWRTGAFELFYETEEDDEEFKVSKLIPILYLIQLIVLCVQGKKPTFAE